MQEKFEQLDLFGFPVEPPKPSKKKEVAAKQAAIVTPAPESVVEEAVTSAAVVDEPEMVYAPDMVAEPVAIVEEQPAGADIAIEPEIAHTPEITSQPEQVTDEEPATVEQTLLNTPHKTSSVKTPKNPSIIKTPGKRGRKSFREMDSEVDLIEVPEDAILEQKLYYSISEVAGWFKVNTSLLRFWENEFDILQPRKTRKGDRLFRVEDIKNLQLIYFLLRQRKFSIDGAKKYLKNNKKEADTHAQLVQSLTKFRSFLLELKTNLAG